MAAVSHLLPLARGRSRSALCSDVVHLAERGLVATIEGPPHGACRHRRLLLLTNLGLAVLANRYASDPRELARGWGLRRGALDALIRQLPAVLSTYELLALLVGSRGGGKARLRVWQCPWRWGGTKTGSSAPTSESALATRGIRLPAYADLEWCAEGGQRLAGEYVLVADTGGIPPQAVRTQLARLARVQLMIGSAAPVVAIATTSERRVVAWSAVLDSLSAQLAQRMPGNLHQHVGGLASKRRMG